jgi:hypothetical protein
MDIQQVSTPFVSEKEKVHDKETDYILSFNEIERAAYEIAKSHLQSSFNLQKSNGFHQFTSNSK